MRRAFTRAGVIGAAVLAGVVGLALPAGAAITAPTSGATVSGNVTLSDNGANSAGESVNLIITTVNCDGSTNMFVDSGTGTTVGSTTVANLGTVSSTNSTNPQSGTWNTSLSPNGAYEVNSTEIGYKSDCITKTTTNAKESVTVTNTGALTYGSASSAPQGTSINVSATLTDQAGVAPSTAQTVSFGFLGQPAVNASTTPGTGLATATLTVPQGVGPTTLVISYAGTYFTAVTDDVPYTITKDPATVTIPTPAATVFGQPAQWTADVTSQIAGEPTPTGTVNFLVDGTSIGTEPLVGGVATSPTDSSLSVGNHGVVAEYSGDGNFLAANSATATQTVNQAPTMVTLQSSVSNSKYGESITYTAQVTTQLPGAGVPTGSVSFTETPTGGAPQPIGGAETLSSDGTPNQSATMSVPISILPAGSYTITATYSGGAGSSYATNSGQITQVVSPAGTMVTLQSSAPDYAVFGQPVTYTATVVSVLPGQGTPTGSVAFTVDGNALSSEGLNSSGQATSLPISTLNPAQPHNVVATYTNSDGNYVSGTTANLQQLVLPDPTTTVISTVPQQSVWGQPVSFTATVTANAPGAGTPTGSVEFTINGVDVGTPVNLNGSGVATVSGISNLVPGTYTISGVYSNADGDFAGSGNPDSSLQSATLTVNQDPTTTSVVSSVNPTVFGQATTFTATVSANAPGAGTPTGTVTFMDGSMVIGTGTLDQTAGNDQATFTTSSLAVGSHAISAVYGGDSDFLTSTGNLNQTVNQDPSITTVAQNGQSVQGQAISFTATVAAAPPGAGTPTGTVIFEINGAPFDTETLVNGSATSASLSDLTPGTYEATALYLGDTNFLASSGDIGQIVSPASTQTSLSASPPAPVFGQPVTLSASVAPTGAGTGTPTGSVAFYDGQTLLGEVPLNASDVASLTVAPPGVGPHAYSAAYSGEYDYAGSTSNTLNLSVGVISTSTAVASSSNPSQYTGPVTFTATVVPSSTVSPAPSGTVTFKDGSTTIGSAPLTASGSAYTASITVSNLAVGSHGIVASYSGAGDYGASASSSLSQSVTAAKTTLSAATLSGSTVSATLTTAYGPVAGQSVAFTTGSTALCTGTTSAQGVASCTLTELQTLDVDLNGGYTATYAGSTDYTSATGTGKS